MEQAMGLVAGTVDGELEFGLRFDLHGVGDSFARFAGDVKACFGYAATVETPHGSADFVDEGALEDAYRGKVLGEFGVEFGPGGLVGWSDEVVGGEEAFGNGVFG